MWRRRRLGALSARRPFSEAHLVSYVTYSPPPVMYDDWEGAFPKCGETGVRTHFGHSGPPSKKGSECAADVYRQEEEEVVCGNKASGNKVIVRSSCLSGRGLQAS